MTIFWQTAARTFDPTPTVLRDPDLDAPEHLIASDLDEDGDVDLVVAGFLRVLAFLQTTPGVYLKRDLRIEATFTPTSVAVVDLDGDADPDVVVSQVDTTGAGRDGGLSFFYGAH